MAQVAVTGDESPSGKTGSAPSPLTQRPSFIARIMGASPSPTEPALTDLGAADDLSRSAARRSSKEQIVRIKNERAKRDSMYSAEEIAAFKLQFAEIDVDGSGSIDATEVAVHRASLDNCPFLSLLVATSSRPRIWWIGYYRP